MNILKLKNSILSFTDKHYSKITKSLFLVIICLYFFVPVNKEMHALWSVPYYSGVVNSEVFKDWKIATEDIDQYKGLNWDEKLNYQFKKYPKDQLMDYQGHGYIGFLYVAKIIHKIAPNIPLIKAVKYTHIILQLFIIFIITMLLPKGILRILFLVLYGLNPVILVFTKMPIYYFWQVLPAFILVVLLLRKKKLNPMLFILFGLILGLSLLIRVTVVGFILSIILLLFHQRRYIALPLVVIPMMLVYMQLSPPKVGDFSNFHTPFIGLGAYPNDLGIKILSDDEGVNYYKKHSDSTFSFSFEGGYFNVDTKAKYFNTMKDVYIDYAYEHPFQILRNATINTIQGYSFGHFANNGFLVNFISFLSGMLLIILLFIYKKYWLFVFIGLGVGTVSLFYPPIQSYMFGSYLLIVIAVLMLISEISAPSIKKSKTTL